MINSALYREPVLLEPARHRPLKIGTLADFSIARGMHAVFLAATEIPQAALEFPVVFVHTGVRDEAGRATVSPIALLGLSQGENLFVEGTRWEARYIPAFIRRYPFLTANLRGAPAPGVMIDRAWTGFSETEGEPLFGDDGQPAPALQRAIEFLDRFETEAQRTQLFCARIAELDLLKEMKADATLPDGMTLSIDGFYVIDDEKLRALADAPVLEMHRNGMLALLNLHLASTNHLRAMVERKARRAQAAKDGAKAEGSSGGAR
ncbi:MAG: SapC family protein [Piscinibacter sp.]|uniref:SapC family protein n=1 Tax=Piscinibacter TaxID=1114981 RepID=UPI000FDE6588|nr:MULTISPECIES: SapC family protein [Piscinibacter]MCW5666574.1 SapC family protein [Piscinibacter sp.]